MLKTELFLGGKSAGHPIDSRAIDAWLKEAVAPTFPGFTVVFGDGYWRGEWETVRILTVIHDGEALTVLDLADIAASYKATFAQESVLIVHTNVGASF
jgi:hypothetical protein